MNIGKVIKDYREKNQMTMQDFADKCNLSKGYISMLEKGKHPQNNKPIIPSIETVQKLSAAMGISIDTLLESLDRNQLVDVSRPSYSFESAQQDNDGFGTLIDIAIGLNDDGMEKLVEYAQDLDASGRYHK